MAEIKGYRLYVGLGASQTRKRLKGKGFGVRKVETAGTGRALIIHTATRAHRDELHALFQDVLESDSSQDEPGESDQLAAAPPAREDAGFEA